MRQSSQIDRNGVFALTDIPRGEVVAVWGGHIIQADDMAKLPSNITSHDYPVQIYDNFFLGPIRSNELDDAEMFNHSCDPNAGIKGQNILVARRHIKAGEEICFDYETTDIVGLNFVCQCGATCCRAQITGQAWQDHSFRLKHRGYMSWYIQEKIKWHKRHQLVPTN